MVVLLSTKAESRSHSVQAGEESFRRQDSTGRRLGISRWIAFYSAIWGESWLLPSHANDSQYSAFRMGSCLRSCANSWTIPSILMFEGSCILQRFRMLEESF